MQKKVILTGLRANNDLHIGNYFGALLPIIDMAKNRSEEYQVNLFVPDLHSFTTPIDHSKLYEQILHNVRIYLAAGLPTNNDNIFMYRQSYLSAHSELTWILDCFTGFGEMSRMTQFKDKSSSLGSDRTSVGLFNYPVLMAADILLYGATYVPVGDDQTQHLEFTRDIAERFNKQFGDIFTIPAAVKDQHAFFGNDQGLRIKDLVDPTKKMSKSDESGKGVIFLGDEPELAAKKIMSATTDNLASIHFNRDKQPGISNLLEILALIRGDNLEGVIKQFEGQTVYGDFKKIVAEDVKRFLSDFQARLRDISDEQVMNTLERSERLLEPIAGAMLLKAQMAVGLRSKEA